ncbi:MAG: LON peptidase substrate-binding domain-containing protein [Ferruginibacter sp.]
MTNFIPIFPLGIVVYPDEELNLHIFEPRYKQLVSECKEEKKPFGIPAVIGNKVSEMGTLMELLEVTKLYDNVEMDIKTRGIKIFRMLEIVKLVPGKLYSGAIVNYPENFPNGNRGLMHKVVAGIRRLHSTLKIDKAFNKADNDLWSYEVAHHAGLSIEEEYELLQLMHELQRQEYLKRHLLKVLPVVTEMESLKDKIKLNGHFKNLGGFDL